MKMHMLLVIVVSGVLAAQTVLADAPVSETDAEKIRVAKEMLDAWNRLDFDRADASN